MDLQEKKEDLQLKVEGLILIKGEGSPRKVDESPIKEGGSPVKGYGSPMKG